MFKKYPAPLGWFERAFGFGFGFVRFSRH
jgi:hypothetical protein